MKWGRPAASEGVGLAGSREADWIIPYIWTEVSARSWVNALPVDTNSENCSIAARRDALYASEMTMAKYLGRRKDGTVDLILSKRSLNHAAGCARRGKVVVCL